MMSRITRAALDRPAQRTTGSSSSRKWGWRRSVLCLLVLLPVIASVGVLSSFKFIYRILNNSEEEEYYTGAFATCSDEDLGIGLTDTTVTISCRTFEYKAPLAKLKSLTPDTIVFGVLSNSGEGRKAVRQTWGAQSGVEGGSSFIVLFLVSSPRFEKTFEKEYNNYQDLIWIGKEDTYLDLTYKTGALILITNRFLPSEVPYVFKTDDDVYVNVPVLQRHLFLPTTHQSSLLTDGNNNFSRTNMPIDYMGWCLRLRKPLRPGAQLETWSDPKWALSYEDYPEPYFPPYCIGRGYAMSRTRFLPCAASHFPTARYLPFEDTAVGLLAERCNITHTNIRKKDVGQDKYSTETPGRKLYQHGIESFQQMKEYHELVLRANRWNVKKKTQAPT